MRFLALTLALLAVAAGAGAETIPNSQAKDHVGKEVTVEGRIVATHASPLATVLAFAPNFAGFTATILAADRAKFPAALEEVYPGKLVRVTGLVTAYRGKPEMTLREPSQLALVSAPGETPAPIAPQIAGAPSPTTSPEANQEETRRILAAIETRLAAVESRLGGLEQSVAVQADAIQRSTREPRLAIGATTSDVRALFGQPIKVTAGLRGRSEWFYSGGRSLTFDEDGRVVSWSGF